MLLVLLQFKPERWLDPSYATDPSTGVPRFVPFGIGPKACVAQQMAMVQCKVRVGWLQHINSREGDSQVGRSAISDGMHNTG
jgi:cytochrome P450